MSPNPYESPKQAGYRPYKGKPVMALAAKWMAFGAFTALVITQLLCSFLPAAMFGLYRFWFFAMGLALATWLAVRADRYPKVLR